MLSICLRHSAKPRELLLLRRLTVAPNHLFSTTIGNRRTLEPSTVLQTLTSYSNDWKKAFEFFCWVETHPSSFSHTTDTYNMMIDILGKFFEFDLAWSLIHKMPQSPLSNPNYITFRTLFKRYVSARLVNEAITTYNDKMEAFNLKNETSFSHLIDALCEHKHVFEAHEIVFANDTKYPPKIYSMILRGWMKIGWWRKCREFWEEMDRRNIEKDLHTYSIYMDLCCKCGKPWKAVKVYKELKRRRVKLDVVTYNVVIRALGMYRGVDFSIRLIREMWELGFEPNAVTYNTVIGLLCDSRRMQDAHKVVGEMRKRGIGLTARTYHSFFTYSEKPKELLALFDGMVEGGVKPRMDTFVMVMRKFGRWGFLKPVLYVWEKMKEMGFCPDEFAYNALIDALIDKGLLDLARKYEQEMLDKGLSAKPRKELNAEKLIEDGVVLV